MVESFIINGIKEIKQLQKALYSGKAKTIYNTDNENELIAEFKDAVTAFNNKKKELLPGKGELNAQISYILFNYLNNHNINTHLINIEDNNKLRIKKLKMIPIEIVVRNITTGSICNRYGKEEGLELKPPIIEYFLKNDSLNDPLINESHLTTFKIIRNEEDLNTIKDLSYKINDLLLPFFEAKEMLVVDFKLEFGYDESFNIILGDELSPDNIRLWDQKSRKSLDKDLFRKGIGNLIESYKNVLQRLKTIENIELPTYKYKAELHIKTRKNVLNPVGQAVQNSLNDLNYSQITNVKIGKYIEIDIFAQSKEQAKTIISSACEELLANPVIEDFEIKVI